MFMENTYGNDVTDMRVHFMNMIQEFSFINHPIRPDSKIPFILDILPHLKVGDSAPVDAFCSFLDRFSFIKKYLLFTGGNYHKN